MFSAKLLLVVSKPQRVDAFDFDDDTVKAVLKQSIPGCVCERVITFLTDNQTQVMIMYTCVVGILGLFTISFRASRASMSPILAAAHASGGVRASRIASSSCRHHRL